MPMPVPPLKPPYYAVVFSSARTEGDHSYAGTAVAMIALAARQPGFLGVDSAHSAGGLGITVSYWQDEASIAAWRADADHTMARKRGRAQWYESYTLHIARVERSYGFTRPPGG
jgi:heme-degrading monooxygenase HmoA